MSDEYDAATLKKVRAAVRGAQSKLKARRGNSTRVAGRVVSRPSSTGRAGRVRSFLRPATRPVCNIVISLRFDGRRSFICSKCRTTS